MLAALCVVLLAMIGISLNSFLGSDTHPFTQMMGRLDLDHFIVFCFFSLGAVSLYLRQPVLRLIPIAAPLLVLTVLAGLTDDLLAAVLHAAGIVGLGAIASRALRRDRPLSECLFLGVPVYVVLLGALSLLGLIGERMLIGLDVVAVLAAVIVYLRTNGSEMVGIVQGWRDPIFATCLLLFSIVLVRSIGVVDHDPNWYSYYWMGSLSEPSLWSQGGYVNAVYAYGKVMEVMNGPLGFRESPSAEILFTALFPIAAISFAMRRLDIELASLRFALLLLLIGAPAMLGVAATGKADILPIAALILFCTVAVGRTMDRDYPLVLVCIAVFVTSKPTYLVWGGVLCLVYLLPLLRGLQGWRHWTAMGVSILSVIVLWGITYANTGIFYAGLGPAVALQEALGITQSNPFTNVDLGTVGIDANGIVDRILRQLFDPGSPGNHGLSWSGLALFPSLVVLVARARHVPRVDLARAAVVLLVMLAIVGLMKAPSQSLDGFYLLPAFIYLTVLAIRAMGKPDEEVAGRRDPSWRKIGILSGIAVSFVAMIAGIYLGQWRIPLPGTDLLAGDIASYEENYETVLAYNELTDVHTHMMTSLDGEVCRARFVLANRQPGRAAYQMPCNVENSFSFSWQPPLRRAFLLDPDVTAQYLDYADSRFIVVERGQEALEANLQWLLDAGYDEVPLGNDRWRLYDRASGSDGRG
ncbi:MAG: hypothetical protein WBF53_15755 [Litorimonas sp.]